MERIFDLYLHGNNSGPLTYRAIAELFSKEGIPSPGIAKKNPNKKRAAHLWSIPTISRIIRNPVYKSIEIDERYAGLKRTGERLEAAIAAATISDESIADFTLFSEDASAGVYNPDYATKRRWLDYLKVKVEVDNKIATVSCMLPVESRHFDLRTAYTSSRRRMT